MRLKDKYAVVTGASVGIGRTIAVGLAKEGAVVALVARSKVGLQETKRLIEKENGKSELFTADLSSTESTTMLIESVKDWAQAVDIIVNVAGVWHGKNEAYSGIDFEKYPKKIVLDTFNVGIIAPTLLAHGLLPLMPTGGKIINISGTFEGGAKGWLPYYTSKKALEDLTVGLAEELKDRDIQVNAISPSDTATEAYKKYFPEYIKDAIEPKEIARYVISLCLKKSKSSGKIFVIKKGKEPFESFHF